MKNLEIEYKAMINKEGYDRLLKKFETQDLEVFDQVNYYYETKDNKLHKNKLTLRIREYKFSQVFVLTLKESLPIGHMEHEFSVQNNSVQSCEVIQNILNKYDISYEDLYNYSSLRTIRKQVKINDALLCIDHSFYNDCEDYEVECEADDLKKAKSFVETLLQSLAISYKESSLSKVARAKQSLSLLK